MHRLLDRQLRKYFPEGSPETKEFGAFKQAVLEAYLQADEERRMIERSLELMSTELLERNDQLQRDLEAIKRLELELRQADKLGAVGRLAAGIAHEINTPIQFVGDSVAFLKDACRDIAKVLQCGRSLSEAVASGGDARAPLHDLQAAGEEVEVDFLLAEVPTSLDRAAEGVSRVAQIVVAMKDFGRPDQRERVLVDINRGLANTLIVARAEIKYCADVETFWGAIPFVSGYPGDLNQVFLNLLVNAAHAVAARFPPEGERGLISVKTEQEGDSVVVVVADNGAGILPDIRQHIFEPFFTTKPVGKGTGQGLAIARSIIVDKHGGSLGFESEMGKGTTFVIRLPIEQPRATSVVSRAPGAAGAVAPGQRPAWALEKV